MLRTRTCQCTEFKAQKEDSTVQVTEMKVKMFICTIKLLARTTQRKTDVQVKVND